MGVRIPAMSEIRPFTLPTKNEVPMKECGKPASNNLLIRSHECVDAMLSVNVNEGQ